MRLEASPSHHSLEHEQLAKHSVARLGVFQNRPFLLGFDFDKFDRWASRRAIDERSRGLEIALKGAMSRQNALIERFRQWAQINVGGSAATARPGTLRATEDLASSAERTKVPLRLAPSP